jgi:hypothetical protein
MEATAKAETLQERFKLIFRDGEAWITMEEYFFGPSLSSSVELTAEKHLREGRYLFDTALWSLHPSECFEAAMANGTHVILLIPAGRICISQQLAASASQLGDNARSFKDSTRKRVANFFRKIVESHIEELLKQEEYGKDMKIGLGKQDEHTDTESGNDSSEEGGGDGFRNFEDDTFLESDESGYGSEDYTDDETDDEEDSDDEVQVDDDSEVIDDWVSV